MKILQYTPKIQKELGLKLDPAPWMHIAIQTSLQFRDKFVYAIFPWDSREVLDSGDSKYKGISQILEKQRVAKDNAEDLKGSGDPIDILNYEMGSYRSPGKAHKEYAKKHMIKESGILTIKNSLYDIKESDNIRVSYNPGHGGVGAFIPGDDGQKYSLSIYEGLPGMKIIQD